MSTSSPVTFRPFESYTITSFRLITFPSANKVEFGAAQSNRNSMQTNCPRRILEKEPDDVLVDVMLEVLDDALEDADVLVLVYVDVLVDLMHILNIYEKRSNEVSLVFNHVGLFVNLNSLLRYRQDFPKVSMRV